MKKTPTKVRKKWIVLLHVGIGSLTGTYLHEFMESVKSSFPPSLFEEFFETKTLVFYVPRPIGLLDQDQNQEFKIELHEIILDAVGYDIYETTINNKNLKAADLLDKLKELIDVQHKE